MIPQAIVSAIGGKGKYEALPVLDLGERISDYLDFIKWDEMNAPIMGGTDKAKRPFIAIRYKVRNMTAWVAKRPNAKGLEKSEPLKLVATVHKRYPPGSEFSLWVRAGKCTASALDGQLRFDSGKGAEVLKAFIKNGGNEEYEIF